MKKVYNKVKKEKKKDCHNYGQDQGQRASKKSISPLKANTIDFLAN